MSKHKLDMGDLTENFFEDTRLLGLVAPVSDYQLCWHLNNGLRFDFRNNPDITIPFKKKNLDTTFYFTVSECKEQYSALAHYLYNNQFKGEYLLPELKKLDYIWLMKGDMVTDLFVRDLMEMINELSCVRLVLELFPSGIKSKGNLIF
ncbi:MAG TPA: IPExxxVDY family protein [Flavitalea sp.]|nr:IPExxxVDY family protein [Flavitalea sp.]